MEISHHLHVGNYSPYGKFSNNKLQNPLDCEVFNWTFAPPEVSTNSMKAFVIFTWNYEKCSRCTARYTMRVSNGSRIVMLKSNYPQVLERLMFPSEHFMSCWREVFFFPHSPGIQDPWMSWLWLCFSNLIFQPSPPWYMINVPLSCFARMRLFT